MATSDKPAPTTAAPRASRRNTQVGVVMKAKMEKSVVVAVEHLVRHDLYRKILKRTSRFMAHDELGCKAGDTVRIVESRPLSKRKRWTVEAILSRVALSAEELAKVRSSEQATAQAKKE